MARSTVSHHRRPLIQHQEQRHNNDEATISVHSHETHEEEREPPHPTETKRTASEPPKKSLRSLPVMTSSSASSTTTNTDTSSTINDAAFRIRSNYLHRLGLETAKEQQLAAKQKSQSQQKILAEDIPHVELLKQDYGSTDFTISESSLPIVSVQYRRQNHKKKASSAPALSALTSDIRRAVSFNPSVCVHAIPGRQLYSPRIQQTIWMMHGELRRSIAVNSIEFMAEGMDPSKVLEESDFLYNETTQSLTHPAHFVDGFQDIVMSLESSMGGGPTTPPSPDHLSSGTRSCKRSSRKTRARKRQDDCAITSCMVL